MKLEIEKTLVISTEHISTGDNEKLVLLTRDCGIDDCLTVHAHDNGFRVKVDLYFSEDLEKMYAGFSAGFVKCMMFAYINDCAGVNFDSDGSSYDFLPKYEW
jgi:hypothetical protein